MGVVAFIALVVGLREKRRDRKVARREPRVSKPSLRIVHSDTFEPETAQPAPAYKALQGPAYVVDGDTIRICKTQIRLFGIDAPEMNHPYGKKAKWTMVGLCKGHSVRAEILEFDAHGRTVARCYLPDGRDLSAEMVKLGLAIDWPKYSGGVYSHLEVPGVRRRLWLADARQKGRMHVWERFEAAQQKR